MTELSHLARLQGEKLPDLNQYSFFLSEAFSKFIWVVFPVRTTLLKEDFLETSIESVRVNWSIFVNSIKAVISNDNALVDPVCNKLIDSFRILSENRLSSQEAIILLTTLASLVQKLIDNATLCNSTITNIKSGMNNIIENSEPAILNCKQSNKFGVARDIQELKERIEELIYPLDSLLNCSNQVLQFWINIKEGVNKVVTFYIDNSSDIDSASIKSLNRSFSSSYNSHQSIKSLEKSSFFTRLFKKAPPAKNSEIRQEFKTHKIDQNAKFATLPTEHNVLSNLGVNTKSIDSKNKHLSLQEALSYITTSSIKSSKSRYASPVSPRNVSNFNSLNSRFTKIKKSYDSSQSFNSASTNRNSNSSTNVNNRSSTYSLSNSNSTIKSSISDSPYSAVPASSVYWIAKNINEIMSNYDIYIENSITILESYLS
ncbi:hypothetical protein BB561_003519 [Smittium simulii]|uniref:Uncharacterized protein n=1 Tax=Smittium simulii TaxID=133385 RepID=A0A2T9YKV7_9FUNG|nr:hypothetical protein BB561_003519 [Smittium simulii]